MSRLSAVLANDELLSSADAAKILGLSSDMVRLLARDGRLSVAAESVRGVRLFRKSDVEALAAERAGHRAHHHIVQFYDEPAFLEGVVADFLGEGLRLHGPVLMFATSERRDMVLERLSAAGRDVEHALSSDNLTLLDAREGLDQFMVGGTPDPKRFRKYIGHLIEQSRTSRTRFRVYGEMAEVLCRDGLMQAALRFEELWNEVARECRLSRLCAYAMDSFRTAGDAESFERVCALHTRVVPTERYVDSADPQERLRNIAVLEQRARSLQNEVELRRQAEREVRELKAARPTGAAR